ncbi:acyl-CoA dehydrogenase family protein [Crenobacter caeni]|uniref:Acyl-CoA dehydrogenase n=1 Tax=Crenobacter caeni TaxID=2705474 RepID=A0A6B2KRQ1_9NEIS|nr:acyl-CoA dehydrogenase family protein [Crenobacter caeni]NDV12731.1 acyl-CoA dehydrogenase [Crenobacter caeni]
MQFTFTEEQRMIRDAVAALLAEQSTSAQVRAAMASATGTDDALWQALAVDMQACAVLVPEHLGGLGTGFVEAALIGEQLGRHVACVPYHATVGLAVSTLLACADDAQQAAWLPGIAEGTTIASVAGLGENERKSADGARFRSHGDGYLLCGHFAAVPHAHVAGLLLVAAQAETGDTALFALPAGSRGLTVRHRPTMDQTRAQAEVLLNDVALPASARLARTDEKSLATARVCATVLIAAELLGVADASLAMAVGYTGERRQFGRAIASYQAIKHRAADMLLKAELARSAVYYAACVASEALFGRDDAARKVAAELPQAASLAKTYAGEAAFYNAGSALQLFGGVGFTWEYDVHLYFKRAQGCSHFLGSPALHRERVARALLD